MIWTAIARAEHKRSHERYPGNMKDREWKVVEPLLSVGCRGGWRRTSDLRDVMNAILHIASNGCQWRMPSKDFPPVSTVRAYFYDWRNRCLFGAINNLGVMSARESEGEGRAPPLGVIDNQSTKTTESGCICGYDAGKKIKGRKRHVLTDTCQSA